jgi:ABC-type transport system involved in cytochrome c biogenesis permease subunit
MLEMSIVWLRVATGLYSLGLLHAILTLLRRESRLFNVALGTFCAGLILHFVAIVQLGVLAGSLPVNNFNESLSFCAFLLGLLYLLVNWRYQFSSLSLCIFPLVFLMTQVGSMEFPVASWSDTRVRSAWLLLHIFLVLLGYAGLALTSVASIFYLIRERQLKRKTSSKIFDRLPPLGTLDDLITRSMGFGFVFITLGVIVGITWAFIEFGTGWMGHATIVISLITWLIYLLMVFLRMTAGWRGRKAALMALSVLSFSVLTWVTHVTMRSSLLR